MKLGDFLALIFLVVPLLIATLFVDMFNSLFGNDKVSLSRRKFGK